MKKTTGLAALVVWVLMLLPSQAQADSFRGTCKVRAGAMGGNRFATLDCRPIGKTSQNWDSTTTWEHKDKKGFDNLARASGRTFNCLFKNSSIGISGDARTTGYSISDCK